MGSEPADPPAPPPDAEPCATALLVDELQAGVEFVDHGVFSVDVEQAGDKLDQFQLAEPALWVLLALEAGLALAPRQVLVGGPLDGVDLVFVGVELSADELDSTRARRLGTQLGSESREGALELLGHAARAAEHARGHARIYTNARGLCVEVRGDPCRRERELTSERCWAALVPVMLEYQPVSAGPASRLDAEQGVVPFAFEGREIGVAGYTETPHSALLLTRHGVVYERVELPQRPRVAGRGLLFVVDLPLPRDLSLTRFLRQAQLEALIDAALAFAPKLDQRTRALAALNREREQQRQTAQHLRRRREHALAELEHSSSSAAGYVFITVIGIILALVLSLL